MPFDQPQGGGGGDGPRRMLEVRMTLQAPSPVGENISMAFAGYMVDFTTEDALPAGTIVSVIAIPPCPTASVSYQLFAEDGSICTRIFSTPLR